MTDFVVAAALAMAKVLDAGNKVVYVTTLPEVLDFTGGRAGGDLYVYGADDAAKIPLSRDRSLMMQVSSLLQESILKKGTTVVGWDVKNLFTYLRAVTGAEAACEATVLDLMALERYLGDRQASRPATAQEAFGRLRKLMKDTLWDKARRVHFKVVVPLITKVLPSIETCGLVHAEERAIVYPWYHVDGQENGRLQSTKSLLKCFCAHNVGYDEASKLYPTTCDHVLALFDYRHMEVSVLAWLSKDAEMLRLLDGEEDFYSAVFRAITGIEDVTAGHRKLTKGFFLPTFYGQGVQGLAERNGVSPKLAEKLVGDVNRLFPTAMAWIRDSVDADGVAEDHYGRRRQFSDRYFRGRNFKVQSPAALICIDRLVHLYNEVRAVRIAAHVHDGYLLAIPESQQKDLIARVKDALEAESVLAQGLRLRVNFKVGKNYGDLVQPKPHLIEGD
jgi:hypothetical protein